VVKQQAEAKVNQAKDSANTVIDAKKVVLKAQADSLLKSKKDSIATNLATKMGVNKDSVDKSLEEAKKKAEGVLKGLLKKKKKGN
jgi:folate-dependent phosphoribosylglycinamide formyltransferase PurN